MNTLVRASRDVLEPATFRPFPLDEYEMRWERVHAAMDAKGYDAAVVWGKTSGVYERAGDIIYLANFFSTHSGQEPDTSLWNGRSYGAVLMQSGQVPELITDEAEARFDIIATERFQGLYDPIRGVAQALNVRGIKGRVALVGSDFLPMKYWLQLESEASGIEWVFDDDLVRDIRRVKSDRELVVFREAGELVTSAQTALMEALIAGRRESEAAAEAGRILLEGQGFWHRIAISHGKFSKYLETDPIRGFSTLAPQRGDMVHAFIYGPIRQGYWLDPGRTAVCGGTPSPEQKHVVEALVNVMARLMAEIKPGLRIRELAELADKLTGESGYASDFLKTNWPYYGHSCGCMWEAPYIESRLCSDDDVFEENMVASVEGFFDAGDAGTAVFETNYIVTSTGVDEITPVPHLFW